MHTITYADGTPSQSTDTIDEALAILGDRLPEMYHYDDGSRTLVWACEEDSTDDDGAHAVAEISHQREAVEA